MNSLMIGAPKLDGLGTNAIQRSSKLQKEHNSNFRTHTPYQSLGSKASFKHECKHPAQAFDTRGNWPGWRTTLTVIRTQNVIGYIVNPSGASV